MRGRQREDRLLPEGGTERPRLVVGQAEDCNAGFDVSPRPIAPGAAPPDKTATVELGFQLGLGIAVGFLVRYLASRVVGGDHVDGSPVGVGEVAGRSTERPGTDTNIAEGRLQEQHGVRIFLPAHGSIGW